MTLYNHLNLVTYGQRQIYNKRFYIFYLSICGKVFHKV